MPELTKPTGAGGRMAAKFSHISDPIIEARDNWPAALRVVYDSDEGPLTLAAPLDATCARTVQGFVSPYEGEVPTGEARLRLFLEKHLITDDVWVSAYKGFIKSRLAPAGKHAFALHEVRRFTRRSDNAERIGFTVRTKEGLETGFTAPWPDIGAVRGETPDKDEFNINDQKTGAEYLVALGLDLDKWEQEMQESEALWPRPGVKSLFSDDLDLMPDIMQAIVRHGVQWVQIEIVDDPQYGLGPRREGQYHKVAMKIYATDDSTPTTLADRFEAAFDEPEVQKRTDFGDELEYFTSLYDSLTKLVLDKSDAQFTINGALTDEGRKIAVAILAPVVGEFPHIVKGTKQDGSPALEFPITEEGWDRQGLHWLAELAARLMTKNDLADIKTIVSTDMVEWARANVPELSPAQTEVL